MDKYIGTKLIEAKKMSNHEFAIEKYGAEKLGNEKMDGYKVRYEDGYESWSPKEVFEAAYNKLNGNIEILDHELIFITKDNTYITHDEPVFNAPHNYIIQNTKTHDILAGIHFQEGPLKENDLNGVSIEDLIAICINRLEYFQDSVFKCEENQEALSFLKHSLNALKKRTDDRKKRNVEGKYEV